MVREGEAGMMSGCTGRPKPSGRRRAARGTKVVCHGKEIQSVTHYFTCRPCPGCGDPHYIDGCLGCGHGIDGRDLSGGACA